MTKKNFFIALGLLLFLHIVLVIAYGMQKQGFHEDEYYTYWSSAGDYDLGYSGVRWRSGYEYMSQFFVNVDDRFDFDTVIANQAEDVHPPLYYLALNVLMSIMAGSFYKWFGIGLNLLFSLVTLAGISFLITRIDQGKNRYPYALLGAALYAFAPATVSNVMLARMYAMSGMWTVIFACILAEMYRSMGCSKKKFAILTFCGSFVCFLSFLTHYFCLLNAFFLTLFYGIFVLIRRRKELLRYIIFGVCLCVGIANGVLAFPASLDHIFNGYRGQGAISGLKNADYFGYLYYFFPYLNKNVFGGFMVPVLIFVVLAVIVLIVFSCRKKETLDFHFPLWIIEFAASICSILVLMKTALTAGDAAVRYFFPVLACACPLAAYGILKVVAEIVSHLDKKELRNGITVVATALVFLPFLAGHIKGSVLFLYQGEDEKQAFSEEYKEYPAIMICDNDVQYRSWYCADQLWLMKKIMFTNHDILMENDTDVDLNTAEKIVVYMDCSEDVLDKLVERNDNLDGYTLVRHDPFFYVYLLE